MKYADLVLYLVIAGHTEKDLLEFIMDSQEEGKIKNISFILNGLKPNNLGYGNKYGYGYGVKKNSIWSRKGKEFNRTAEV